ncbi:MAG: hypothetical protein ACI9NC_003501 [Verrucomicrobiales bacterium]|jgi:hypothetical protein
MKNKTLPSIVACVVIAIFHTACGGSKQDEEAAIPKPDTSALEAFVSATAPDGALGVVAARAAAKPGEPIVLRGKVGGKMTPISESVAILVLADEEAIKSCDQNPDDECENPWDYCCEEVSKIAASTATIQVKGADGKLVRSSLRGLGDLKELSHLVISGTVDESSTPEALIVNAEKIHIEKP